MILTVEEIKGLIPDISDSDQSIKFRLEGIEQAIKGETNNDFSRYRDSSGEIQWPADIKMGVVEIMRYADAVKGREGIASETISRHSVSYGTPTAAESVAGFPAHLMGFLDPYRRARF